MTRLHQHFTDGLDADIGQRDRTAADWILLLMVDSNCLKDCRKDLARSDFAFLDRVPVLVARAIHSPAPDAAAGERNAPGRRKMIAPQAGVNLWRADKFRKRDDQRVL